MKNTRPTTELEKDALEYLNELRISGATNMYGAAPFVESEFSVERKESIRLLALWMENFNNEGDYKNVILKS